MISDDARERFQQLGRDRLASALATGTLQSLGITENLKTAAIEACSYCKSTAGSHRFNMNVQASCGLKDREDVIKEARVLSRCGWTECDKPLSRLRGAYLVRTTVSNQASVKFAAVVFTAEPFRVLQKNFYQAWSSGGR
jgi:hypothetical protein